MGDALKNFYDLYASNSLQSDADKQLAEAIKNDLLAKLPKIKEHFSEFDPESVEHMVASYGHKRMLYTKHADYYATKAEAIQLEYRTDADKRLQQIQHKKLFNLQCRWRTGQIKLEGIETTYDFHLWETNLYNCPFLPPITQDEVDLMIRFLNETPAENEDGYFDYDWQNYEYLKICFAEEEEMELEEFYQTYSIAIIFDKGIPPWYQFYDTYMGTNGLLGLPDVKKPREMYYLNLYHENARKEKREEEKKAGIEPAPSPQISVPMPWLGLDDSSTEEAFAELVDNFETEENKKLFENFAIVDILPTDEDQILKEELETVLDKLEDAREEVPIEAHSDWRQALIIAYRKYKAKKIIEAIPAAYEDYLMRIQTGLGFTNPEENTLPALYLEAKQQVLEGRKLAGESPDFNF